MVTHSRKVNAGGKEEAEGEKEEELDGDIELADMAACWTSIFSLQGETGAESKVCMAGLAAAVLLASSARYAKGWGRPHMMGCTTHPLLCPFIVPLSDCISRRVLVLLPALARPWPPWGPAYPVRALILSCANEFFSVDDVWGLLSLGPPSCVPGGVSWGPTMLCCARQRSWWLRLLLNAQGSLIRAFTFDCLRSAMAECNL